MPDVLIDGHVAVWWLEDPPADLDAPTIAELTAGLRLEDWITPDGLGIDFTQDDVDASSLASDQDVTVPGRSKSAVELEFKQQGRTSPPWTTFAKVDGEYPLGTLVVRRDVAVGAAVAAAQVVEVYRECRASERRPKKPAKNELSKFTVGFSTRGWNLDAVVAAA